jgi:hypothetical protein
MIYCLQLSYGEGIRWLQGLGNTEAKLQEAQSEMEAATKKKRCGVPSIYSRQCAVRSSGQKPMRRFPHPPSFIAKAEHERKIQRRKFLDSLHKTPPVDSLTISEKV